jgi:hypothetical protein
VIEERTLLLDLKLGEVLLPLGLKELENLELDLLRSLFLKVLEALPALVEGGIVYLSGQDKVVCCGS